MGVPAIVCSGVPSTARESHRHEAIIIREITIWGTRAHRKLSQVIMWQTKRQLKSCIWNNVLHIRPKRGMMSLPHNCIGAPFRRVFFLVKTHAPASCAVREHKQLCGNNRVPCVFRMHGSGCASFFLSGGRTWI